MVDFDPTLSIEDAKNILSNYSNNQGKFNIPYSGEMKLESETKIDKVR